MTVPDNDVGPFLLTMDDASGPSNENGRNRVPATVDTITSSASGLEVTTASRQATDVPDVHEAVPHKISPEWATVGVKLYAPKFNPLIVTDSSPEPIVFFGCKVLKTGAAQTNHHPIPAQLTHNSTQLTKAVVLILAPSNVNGFVALVPTIAFTVTFG